jgi:hypothetical protein
MIIGSNLEQREPEVNARRRRQKRMRSATTRAMTVQAMIRTGCEDSAPVSSPSAPLSYDLIKQRNRREQPGGG